MNVNVLYLAPESPINNLSEVLKKKLIRAQNNAVEKEFDSAGALAERVLGDTRISVRLPQTLYQQNVRLLSDQKLKELMQFFGDLLRAEGVAPQAVHHNAANLAERLQLVTAFDEPDVVIEDVRRKVEEIVRGFPKNAADIQVGKNPGDVLDPYILAATQSLLFGGDFEPAIEATVAHKALMMIEGLMGHLHEDVIGAMRGNVRVPEPRGVDQETLDPLNNPFPGADVVQPPKVPGETMRFHQLKSKTGSAKGGDGRRLGEQLKRLQNLYGGEIFYHALIGNTLRGHRSRAGVEKAAEGVVVLVGEASFEELTGSKVGPQLLLRLYQSAFTEVAQQTGYRVDTMAAGIVATFKDRSEQEGEGFLEVILDDATAGPRDQQDNRIYVSTGRGRKRIEEIVIDEVPRKDF
jgi:hypothetical protein